MKLKYKLTEQLNGVTCGSLRTAKQIVLKNLDYLTTHNKRLTQLQDTAIYNLNVLISNTSFVECPTVNVSAINKCITNYALSSYAFVPYLIIQNVRLLITHNKNYTKEQGYAVDTISSIINAIDLETNC